MSNHTTAQAVAPAPMVTVEAAKIEGVIVLLEDTACSFWACAGPDVPFADMVTCNVCSAVQDLRVLIGLPPTGEQQ